MTICCVHELQQVCQQQVTEARARAIQASSVLIQRCVGLTAEQVRCKRSATRGEMYCTTHVTQRADAAVTHGVVDAVPTDHKLVLRLLHQLVIDPDDVDVHIPLSELIKQLGACVDVDDEVVSIEGNETTSPSFAMGI